jgi:hypothetical protein
MRFAPLVSVFALLALVSAPCAAQSRPVSGGLRLPVPPPPPIGVFNSHHGFPGVWVVERQVPVIVEKEVVREVAVTPPSFPPHQGEGSKRKPYVIGASYASLPGGCMKLIEQGVSFYYCSGDWYREVRAGRSPLYKAVARKL